MIWVRIVDENGYYTGKMELVEEVIENMASKPMMIGYVRPRFIDGEWVEGATEKEIKEWEVANKIDICPEPTTEEKLDKLIAEYNELKSRMINTEEVIMGIMMEI